MSIVDWGKPEDGEIQGGQDRHYFLKWMSDQFYSPIISPPKGDMTAINIQILCLCELRTSIKRLSTLCST